MKRFAFPEEKMYPCSKNHQQRHTLLSSGPLYAFSQFETPNHLPSLIRIYSVHRKRFRSRQAPNHRGPACTAPRIPMRHNMDEELLLGNDEEPGMLRMSILEHLEEL